MAELLTAAQMRAIEASAIGSGEVTGLGLMERAGQGVVEAILAEWADLAAGAHCAVVLCGPGGNGGDGFVVARLLKARGWQVEVFLTGDPDRLPADARANHDRWARIGPVRPSSALDWCDLAVGPLVVDAMFGTGLIRDIPPGVWGSLAMALESRCRIVAVDILSGICADSGRIRSPDFIQSPIDLTVTFQCARVGHHLGQGAVLSGRLRVVPLGLDRALDALLRNEGDDVVDLARPSTTLLAKVAGHKFTHGHALVLAGGPGRTGAARLAARGALRIGAGLVTVGCPPEAMVETAGRLEAVMLRPVNGAADLITILQDRRINALCLGPGLGGARAKDVLPAALAAERDRSGDVSARLRLVLDADALTALSEDPASFAVLHDGCVLTPHGGEFARLFPDLAARLDGPVARGAVFSKVEATRLAAARAGCVVLFKGADTVIAAPSGACTIHSAAYDRAAPWLATAGAGDVLAGFICGLLARGFPPFQAAETAAWLHAECARSFGPGMIAEDLPEEVPKVFRRLGL